MSNKKINITGLKETNDPFYRYQMRKLDVVSQRNTTAIKNIQEVADDLNIDYNILIKYFKKVFGINFVFKKGILTTTKNINYKEFEDNLKIFIEYFVLCQQCRLPEIDIVIENKKVYFKCRSCPHTINIVDVSSINKNKIIVDTINDIQNYLNK